MLSLACKGAAILEINKQTKKTDNIRKFVWTNYVTNVYKTRIVRGRSQIFFLRVLKKISRRIFLTVGQEIGNITFFFRPKVNTVVYLCCPLQLVLQGHNYMIKNIFVLTHLDVTLVGQFSV